MRRMACVLVLAALGAASAASAQDQGEINVFGGIQFGGDVDIEETALDLSLIHI